jgi:hypothetical protein
LFSHMAQGKSRGGLSDNCMFFPSSLNKNASLPKSVHTRLVQ